MKTILPVITSGLLLTACATSSSDASIHRRLIGVWLADAQQQPGKRIENRADGSSIVTKNGVETARGKWQVKDGYVIWGTSSGMIESNKVVRVSGKTAVILSINGQTELTFHRQ